MKTWVRYCPLEKIRTPFILVHFILFSSCHSKKLEKKIVLIRNVKPLEIVLDDDRAALEISNGRGFSRSTTKMLLLLVAAGGANEPDIHRTSELLHSYYEINVAEICMFLYV